MQTDSHPISGHHHNGHIPNGHHPNGHHPNGSIPNGHIPNGHPPPPPPKPNHNGNLPPWGGHLNHAFQPEGLNGNGYGEDLQNGRLQMNGITSHTRPHNHNNEEIIHLNGMPQADGRTDAILAMNKYNGSNVQPMNGHSPQSIMSALPDEINSANERQEEQRKDDRWGSLKKGLKYNHIKGIIASKFSGKHDTKDDSKGGNRGLSSQGTNTRDNSPSKREKNTNLAAQEILNRNPSQSNGPNFAANSPRDEIPNGHAGNPMNGMPINGFQHGAPLRSSVVQFDLPNRQEELPPMSDNLAARRSSSYHQLNGQHPASQNQQHQQQPTQRTTLSQQQLWRQQNKAYTSEMNGDVLPSDQTYGGNGRTASLGVLSTG